MTTAQLLSHIHSFEFFVGVAVGKLLLGALLASSLFRNIFLAAAAAAVCFLYAQRGTLGILAFAHRLHADLFSKQDFASGLIVGAIVAFIVFGLFQRRLSKT